MLKRKRNSVDLYDLDRKKILLLIDCFAESFQLASAALKPVICELLVHKIDCLITAFINISLQCNELCEFLIPNISNGHSLDKRDTVKNAL